MKDNCIFWALSALEEQKAVCILRNLPALEETISGATVWWLQLTAQVKAGLSNC